jgi:hypothetical protein
MATSHSTAKQTLVRQFSIRWLFVVVSIAAVLTLCLRYAMAGQYWAIGAVAAAVALIVLFLTYAALFIVASQLARLGGGNKHRVQSIAGETPPTEQETPA